jgi:hypothetical protein
MAMMAEGNDLSLLSGTPPKCRGDQSQKSYEKWSHRGNDDDLTNRAKTCTFSPDGVSGIHRITLLIVIDRFSNCDTWGVWL